MSVSAQRRQQRFIRSIFGRSESTPQPRFPSHLSMGQLNEDILYHIVPYLSQESLAKVHTIHRVFFDAWMKARYESLAFKRCDRGVQRLLTHLGNEPNMALRYVKRVVIHPWIINPPRITQNLWTQLILDADDIQRKSKLRLQKLVRKDITLVACALNAMRHIKEFGINWDESDLYHPEFYGAFFTPMLQKWSGHLVKLTIKVPSPMLAPLACIRLTHLETLEFHFCTAKRLSNEIEDTHNPFLVFVNNLKDSLECISFISTYTSRHLDITRIYESLGLFPKLRSVSLSIPFDGGHLSDPLAFVDFLNKHRPTLKNISLLTSRCTVYPMPGIPEHINWIQKILTSIYVPFLQLQSLALAIRPLRAPLINISNFLEMHMSTLHSLTLADRAFDYRELEPLMNTPLGGPFDLTGLKHFRIKIDNFCPDVLYYLASEMPGLENLDIECSSIGSHSSEYSDSGTCFITFSREIIANKHYLVNWKLQRMTIGPHDWAPYVNYIYIERALVECMPNLMIATSWYTSR